MRIPRNLDALEIRILGSLLEKQQTTPEYYPLTVNGLQAACTQKSNRDPVMEVTELDINAALDRLKEQQLVWRVLGGRSVRWEHNLDNLWELEAPAKALITLLLLRGSQTPGELRSRSERLYAFTSLEPVEETLRRLAEGPEPFVMERPRRPGQKEVRWTHLLGETSAEEAQVEHRPVALDLEAIGQRLERLEGLFEALRDEIIELKKKPGE